MTSQPDPQPIKTPTYNPKNNSAIINFLLRGIDGGYQRGTPVCSKENEDWLYTKSITHGQFPLYSIRAEKRLLVAAVVLGILGVAAIVAAILSLFSLGFAIPVAVISLLFSGLIGAMFIYRERFQHAYVFVVLACRNCNSEHTVLYDAITKMKRRRFGRYTRKTCVALDVSTTASTYHFVEEKFEEMRDQLEAPGGYDCTHWAKEFYDKIR